MSRRKRCYRRFKPQPGLRVKQVCDTRGWAIQVDMIPLDRWPVRGVESEALLQEHRAALDYVRNGFARYRISTKVSGYHLRTKVFLANEEDFVLLTLVGYGAIYRAYRLTDQMARRSSK